MIYMVDHVYREPASEPQWHAWYAGYLGKLLSVPGIDSAQRFKAIGCTPSRYLAMYTIESEAVYSSAPYRGIGGGGSQSARFHDAYDLWTRNLFDGAARAPAVSESEVLLVRDCAVPDRESALGQGMTWVRAVGLQKTTPYRGFVVLDRSDARVLEPPPDTIAYEPFTQRLTRAA